MTIQMSFIAKLLLVSVAALSLGLASVACGGSAEDTGTVIEVAARDIRFSPDVIEVPAGQTVTLRLTNMDDMEHDLEVRGLAPNMMEGGGHGGHAGGSSSAQNLAVHAQAGKSASVTFRADEKGTYEVFCTQPGHEQLGMVAKLVII
jgi:nitrite reductase (NO-forming)